MQIRGFLKTSAIEWSGKISAVIFTSGCNFRCSFCHNPDLVDPKKFNRLPLIMEKEIITELEKRKKWLDAVVVTGGEPTLQSDLETFLKKVKDLGFKVMLETNGSRPDVIAKLLNDQIIDRFAVDVKGPLDENYAKITRYKDTKIQEKIRKSLKIIMASRVDFELRTTVVPGIHDEKTIKKIAQQIKSLTINHQSSTIKWFLQAFRPKNCLDPKFNKIKPFSPDDLKKFQTTLQKIIPGVELRGI